MTYPQWSAGKEIYRKMGAIAPMGDKDPRKHAVTADREFMIV